MLRFFALVVAAVVALTLLSLIAALAGSGEPTVIGWNSAGFQYIDAHYGVLALFAPGNTLQAQLLDASGTLVLDATGITVTYEAVADPDGSINRTSQGKTDFWENVFALFGVNRAVDVGLAGAAMPGTGNAPQPMTFDTAHAGFVAAGIPITPQDDAGHTNMYPLMRLVARDAAGAVLSTADVTLPVSIGFDCKTCHASNGSLAAQPIEGWVNDPDPERDVRLNILRLHDDLQNGLTAYSAALAAAHYDADGLFPTALGGTAVLCARCHASQAVVGSGISGISSLTRAVHRRMAAVGDPLTGLLLDAPENRGACYRCHPGSLATTVRGPMGAAIGSDGVRAIQCQNCHGRMIDVASAERIGWLDEPSCQSCHTGTALTNSGQLRYTSVFEADGRLRQAADETFATNRDTPATGQSLYRLSTGHGGLQCAACHGPAHAEYPSRERNENLQSQQLQRHVGMLVECTACHATSPQTADGGPHGMHPVGIEWVQSHPDAIGDGGAQACRACHGVDYRGTVLSRAKADRTFDTDFGRKIFWRGFQIGCYTCHRGPSDSGGNPNRAPVAENRTATTSPGMPVDIALAARDADGDALELHVVQQAEHGTVALDGTNARYFPGEGFTGSDSFSFSAWDGSSDGNLAVVSVSVLPAATPTTTAVATATPPPCIGDCDGDGMVGVDELLRGVNIALALQGVEACRADDADGDAHVSIDELVRAINAALNGCTN